MRTIMAAAFISIFLRTVSSFSTTTRAGVSFLPRSKSTVPTKCRRVSIALAAASLTAGTAASNFSTLHPTTSYCDDTKTTTTTVQHQQQEERKDDISSSSSTIVMPFPEDIMKHDHYRGITFNVNNLSPEQTTDPTLFLQNLQDALKLWKAEGKRGIWIQVPTEFSHLIPSCVKAGFDFHLAKPGMVTLRTWLPDSPSRLPYGPTHQVGIGALVLHPTEPNKMLCVQEKTGPAASLNLWKMPTGLADPMEDVADAAIRELKEETGLDATFEGIVCFRQAHTSSGASDLFFVCLLQLKDAESVESHQAQQEEIAAVAWMSMEEYANQEVWQNSPLYKELNEALMRAARQQQHSNDENNNNGFVQAKLPVGFRPGTNSLYMSRM